MFRIAVNVLSKLGETEEQNEIVRSLVYQKDNANRTFTCIEGTTYSHDMKSVLLHVNISSTENHDVVKEAWMVLYGKPKEIVASISKDWPMAKLQSDEIFDCLDTLPMDEIATITYNVIEPSYVIKGSALYKELRICQRVIVADLCEVSPEKVIVLNTFPE